MSLHVILDAIMPPQITSNLTNIEFARILESTFSTPTEFMQQVIARFRELAEMEADSPDEDTINGEPVPIERRCPMCGTHLDITLCSDEGVVLRQTKA